MPAQQVVWNWCRHARKPAVINLWRSCRGQASMRSNGRPPRVRKWDQLEACAPTAAAASADARATKQNQPANKLRSGYLVSGSGTTRGSPPSQGAAVTRSLLRECLEPRLRAPSWPMAPSSTRRFRDPLLETSMRKDSRTAESWRQAAASSLLGGQTAPEPQLFR